MAISTSYYLEECDTRELPGRFLALAGLPALGWLLLALPVLSACDMLDSGDDEAAQQLLVKVTRFDPKAGPDPATMPPNLVATYDLALDDLRRKPTVRVPVDLGPGQGSLVIDCRGRATPVTVEGAEEQARLWKVRKAALPTVRNFQGRRAFSIVNDVGVPVAHLAETIRERGGQALWIETDVTQAAQVEAMVQAVIAAYGRLDYAFNNAGSGGVGGWLAEMAEADWDETIDTYLKSVWLCMKYEILEMLKAGQGVVVNSSSVDGQRGFPWDPAYSAAKHGVLGLTKSAAMQYARRGIRINAVCPGDTATPMIEYQAKTYGGDDPDGYKRRLLGHQPPRKLPWRW